MVKKFFGGLDPSEKPDFIRVKKLDYLSFILLQFCQITFRELNLKFFKGWARSKIWNRLTAYPLKSNCKQFQFFFIAASLLCKWRRCNNLFLFFLVTNLALIHFLAFQKHQ